MKQDASQLERTEELFEFLQGTVPDGHRIDAEHIPHLTAEQAWTVIWYLSELHWQVPDHIERCDACGSLFDTNDSGVGIEINDLTRYFCDNAPCYQKWWDMAEEKKMEVVSDANHTVPDRKNRSRDAERP